MVRIKDGNYIAIFYDKMIEVVAENNNGQVSFEFVKMVSASTIADVELKLSSIENGKGLIDALNNKSK